MANTRNPTTNSDEPPVYQIRVKGHLGPHWADWFAGLTITLEANGDTLLTGPMVDQAALYGVLRKVRDVGLPLLSVVCVQLGQANVSAVKQEMETSHIRTIVPPEKASQVKGHTREEEDT